MLERYSKTKTFMFVRKRKAARKKRQNAAAAGDDEVSGQQSDLPTNDEIEHEEDLQAEKNMPSYAEHAFTFTSFEKVRPSSTFIWPSRGHGRQARKHH